MTFSEILPSLLKGLPVYRKGWTDDHFIYYEEDWDMFTEALPDINFHTLNTCVPLRGNDLAADDWQVDEWDADEEDKRHHIRGVTKKVVVE